MEIACSFLGAIVFLVVAVYLLIKYDCKDMSGHDIDGHKIAEIVQVPPCACGCGCGRVPSRHSSRV